MNFLDEQTDEGVTERLFDLRVADDVVPGVLWTPENAAGPRPIVLLGHGGGQHKRATPLTAAAKRYAKTLGYAVAAIDAPSHGTRVSPEETASLGAELRAQIAQSGGLRGEALQTVMQRVPQAQREWTETLNALQTLDCVGEGRPVGYFGVSLGSILGIPFVAADSRITAAVFGLAGVNDAHYELAQAARRVTIPIEFVLQWDDELVSRESGLALFDAFGSAEKTLHANPGAHARIPAFERMSWQTFFARHLGVVSSSL